MSASISESIENEALRAVHESASSSTRASLGLQWTSIDGVGVSLSRAEPSILINRCFGLGTDQPATTNTIRAIMEYYRAGGISEFFLHLLPEAKPGNVRQLLAAAGMEKSRGWMKFTRNTEPPQHMVSNLDVRPVEPGTAETFASIVAPCFDMLDASIPLLADLADHPDWHLFLGYDQGHPCATGALFVRDSVAYYDWAATHRDFRQRGHQQALLNHLIEQSRAMGCDTLVTATGEAAPGDPQHSYKNILKAGFEEHYLRENWQPK